MPITTFPLTSQEPRKIHVSVAVFWSLVGEESKTILILSNRFFSLGEKVKVFIDPSESKNIIDLPLVRFVTHISQAYPLYLDDDSVLIELSVYNTLEL
jgi:hypothetical protein